MYKFSPLLILIILFISCHQMPEGEFQNKQIANSSLEFEDNYNETPTEPTLEKEKNKQVSNRPRQIIRNAQLNMQVRDVKQAYQKIQYLTDNNEGFISNMNMSNTTYEISNSITIRVPNYNLDSLLAKLENEATFIRTSSIHSKDVSEEFVDISSRLKTKKEVRERYLNILRNKAKTVKEVLLAEEQIRVLTEEIEAKEGRLRYLKDKVGLSTLSLHIYQKVEYKSEPEVYEITFLTEMKEAFLNGWEIILAIILTFINIWPVVLILGLIFGLRKRIFQKFKR